MTDLTVRAFDFDGEQIRTRLIDGEPWFVAADVAGALGYARPNDAVAQHVDDDDRGTTADDRGGPGRIIINESGLYALIFGSKLPAAKRFKRWVTAEVLPALRRGGRYEVEPRDDLDVVQSMLDAVRADRVRLASLEGRAEVIESKISAALGEHDEYAALGYLKVRKLATDNVTASRLGRRASTLLRELGAEARKVQSAVHGEVGIYPVEILDRAVKDLGIT